MSSVPSNRQGPNKPSSNNNAMSNGDNSDNSGFSLGNNSFGFNFDSEENTSPVNSDAGTKSDEDGGPSSHNNTNLQRNQQPGKPEVIEAVRERVSSGVCPRPGAAANRSIPNPQALTHEGAAAATVAQLQNIASQSVMESNSSSATNQTSADDQKPDSRPKKQRSKRKASSETSSTGYNSDDEASRAQNPPAAAPSVSAPSHPKPNVAMKMESSGDAMMQQLRPQAVQSSSGNKKKKLDDVKREERNLREKERSYRITSQINELRNLLSSGGVIVPKGTKNAVLTEAANYIRILQQHQYKSEIHRQQLVQQMQMIGTGQLGPQAANAIRHVAAQNGVWSLGNFGGVPPRSAMTSAIPQNEEVSSSGISNLTTDQSSLNDSNSSGIGAKSENQLKTIDDNDYRFVFNSCAIGMAIASMGGAFIDCNQLFVQLSEYTKQEICGLTIFNLTARNDLQSAFDLISQMISPPAQNSELAPTCVLRGNMKNRTDLGLNITLIKDEAGIAKCFCVTLITNPTSPMDNSVPVHATMELIRPRQVQGQDSETNKQNNMSSPAFMTG